MDKSTLSYSGLIEGFRGEAMVVVRLSDLKLKNLGDRRIDCIFIGYVEHSKAFMFYVIELNTFVSINSIIESTDAIFDENRSSYIPRPSHRILNTSGTDDDDISVSEVPEKEAINDEMDSIIGNNTWVVADLPPSWKPLGCKWIFKRKMKVKDIGEADVMLGIRIKHKSNKISISQSHYIEKVLKRLNYFDCTPMSTPIDISKKMKINNGKVVSLLEYSRVIDCLMYARTYIMPNITFIVGKVSRYTSNPSTQHWQAVQRILKYLKKTRDYSFTYTGYPLVLGYTDTSWINNTKENYSTSGCVFFLGGGDIS
ncbi:zinc finger, CCHC-type containing protein [Tanacetum coccineum]